MPRCACSASHVSGATRSHVSGERGSFRALSCRTPDSDSSQSNDWQSTRSTVNAIVFSSDSDILHQILSCSFSANSTDSRESAILDSESHRTASQARLQCSRAGGAGAFPRFFVKQTNVASVCGQRLRTKECLRRRTLTKCLVSDTFTAFTAASMPRSLTSLGLRYSRLDPSSLTAVSDDATCELVFACLFPFEVSLYRALCQQTLAVACSQLWLFGRRGDRISRRADCPLRSGSSI